MKNDVTLQQRIRSLEQEVRRLRSILRQAGISYAKPPREERITQQHALFFYSVFKGRKDVFREELH